MKSAPLAIGGLVPFTTIDYPGKLAAVLFCQGCAWRCGYCHNPQLLPMGAGSLSWGDVMVFLQTRRHLLEAVVVSGGEPLLQHRLPQALAAVRALGFATGLHTGGPSAQRLRAALPQLDWVGFDVKAPFDRYAQVTGVDCGKAARASLMALLEAGIAHEVRTTVDGRVLDGAALLALAKALGALGVRHWVLQRCRGPDPRIDPLTDAALLARLASQVEKITVR